MERASVTRLYKDRLSHEAVLLLEGKRSKQSFKITVPMNRASILALEGHGLNDRCSIYGVMSECIDRLGGAFDSVVVRLDRGRGVTGSIALSKDGEVSHISADAVELLAFALHVQLPIYVDVTDRLSADEAQLQEPEQTLPEVFESALTDILSHSDTARTDLSDELPSDCHQDR